MIAYFSCFVNRIKRIRRSILSKKTSLFGVLVDDITMSETLNLSKQVLFGKESRQIAVYTPNLEMLEAARRSKEIRELLNSADLLLPDGVGVSLIAGLLGKGVSETVSGIDFGERLFQTVRTENVRVFLLGGKEGHEGVKARHLKPIASQKLFVLMRQAQKASHIIVEQPDNNTLRGFSF